MHYNVMSYNDETTMLDMSVSDPWIWHSPVELARLVVVIISRTCFLRSSSLHTGKVQACSCEQISMSFAVYKCLSAEYLQVSMVTPCVPSVEPSAPTITTKHIN